MTQLANWSVKWDHTVTFVRKNEKNIYRLICLIIIINNHDISVFG